MDAIDRINTRSPRGRLARPMATAVIGLALSLGASIAHAGYSLGGFDTYGLLINNGVHGGDINSFPVNANIGVGDIVGGTVNLHNGVVNGVVDVRFSAANDLSGAALSVGTVNSFAGGVQGAITDALNLSSTYGALAPLGTAVVINGTTTIQASSGYLDATGTRVFTASSFSIGNGHTVTVNGSASDFVVIDVTGASGNKLDGALQLTGGISADHVLINFIGSGGELKGAANGATLEGTFLAPNLKIGLNSLTIDGHLFGGAAGTDFQFVSNAYIEAPVPEPSSYALMAAGLGVVGLTARRRMRADRR